MSLASGQLDGAALLVAIILPFLLALAGLARPLRRMTLSLCSWAALPALALGMLGGPALTVDLPWLFLGVHLGLDAPGHMFLIWTALLWTFIGLFARFALTDDAGRVRFLRFYLASMTGSLGIIFAQDVATFSLFFALMTFAAYGLIVHEGTEAARRAGRLYLALAVVGEALLLEAALLTASRAGGGEFYSLHLGLATAPDRHVIVALVLIGVGIKIGLVPLHVWLPPAYSLAPNAASAVLSGTCLMTGLLGFLRLLPIAELPASRWGLMCAIGGLAGIFYVVAMGLTQENPKTLLGYATISQSGILAVGLGVAMAAPTARPVVIASLLLFVLLSSPALAALYMGVHIAAASQGAAWSRRLIGSGLVLAALALAGASPMSHAIVATGIFTQTPELSPWADWLKWPIQFAAVGTTLLMGRFLILTWPHGRARDGRSAPPLGVGIWLPWAVILILIVSTAFLAAFFITFDRMSPALWPALIGGSLWPVAAGTLLVASAWGVARRFGFAAPQPIPAGDLLLVAEWLIRIGKRGWRTYVIDLLPLRPSGIVSRWHEVEAGPWLTSVLIKAERQLGRWLTVGFVFLLVALCLSMVMVFP